MNQWTVLCQTIMLAFLLMQYQLGNEVEARELTGVTTTDSWFGNLEQKLNVIKGAMHNVFQKLKLTATDVLPQRKHERMGDDTFNTDTVNKIYYFGSVAEDKKSKYDMDNGNDNSDISDRMREIDQQLPIDTHIKKRIPRKKKKKNKKKNKTLKLKRTPELSKNRSEKIIRIKTNGSESNESSNKKKPVDIIVHIKMTE